ncbi:MAG TPA: DUF4032 domain-containing protein [Acidimicrobiales bacterium]
MDDTPSFHLVARTGHPDFLDFPWDRPLARWDDPRIVDYAKGVSRHVVRFVTEGGRAYALKETSLALAEREYGMLRRLNEEPLPAVEAVGVVSERLGADGERLDSVLITQHLEFSLPYRMLFSGRGVPDLRRRLIDALAVLLVRLHLAGFFWGDCSLSNVLFRRDAGALAAYLVDAETGEWHPALSDGQRLHDLTIATENVAGELLDLCSASRLPSDVDPLETADELGRRYTDLWDELTREEVIQPGERHRIEARLRRLNELGFDVEEFELVRTADGQEVRVVARVLEEGHHARRLRDLTGIEVQENQARRLLNDIAEYRAWLAGREGREVPDAVAAYRWLSEVYEPALNRVPADLRAKLHPAELFHEILEHRWYLAEQRGGDVDTLEAVDDYVENELRNRADEHTVLAIGLEDLEDAADLAGTVDLDDAGDGGDAPAIGPPSWPSTGADPDAG